MSVLTISRAIFWYSCPLLVLTKDAVLSHTPSHLLLPPPSIRNPPAGRKEWTSGAGTTTWTTTPEPPHGRGPQPSLCATTSSGRASGASCRVPCTSSASASSTRYLQPNLTHQTEYLPNLLGPSSLSKEEALKKNNNLEGDWRKILSVTFKEGNQTSSVVFKRVDNTAKLSIGWNATLDSRWAVMH